MQTVILAAGSGVRMRPLTDDRPKALLPMGKRPLIEHVLATAVDAGADRIVLVVPPDGSIESAIGGSFRNVTLDYVVQPTPQGTGDAVWRALGVLQPEPFVVLPGDLLLNRSDVDALYEETPSVVVGSSHHARLAPNSPARGEDSESPVLGAFTFPGCTIDRLGAMDETGTNGWELADQLTELMGVQPRIVGVNEWIDVDHPWELLEATERQLESLAPSRAGDIHPDAELLGCVHVEAGATIRSGVAIDGPVLIRSGATIGPNAYVRGATVIGTDAKVGHAVEVKNSILCAGAAVNHQSYVGDSILGPRVNFGAGTNVANLRHDKEPIKTTVQGASMGTGRRKYGVVVGPDARTGIDTSLNVGVVLPTEATTLPGSVVFSTPTEDKRPVSDARSEVMVKGK